MDRYGARGELLAAQHETILGTFLVDSGVERAFEFNLDGSTTVYEHGRTRIEPKPSPDRYKLTRNEWAEVMAERFYDGFYHDLPESFSAAFDKMMSPVCRGNVSPELALWMAWADSIIRQVNRDGR